MNVQQLSSGWEWQKSYVNPLPYSAHRERQRPTFYLRLSKLHLSHVPLLVLTADRPHELRDNGAPQSIDQNRLYGTYAKWFVEVALPEATDAALRYIRTIADRAVAATQAIPSGPVHLNFPFREPLTPEPIQGQPLLQ